jgi:hypothetical protein
MAPIHFAQIQLGSFQGRVYPIGEASFSCSMSSNLFDAMESRFRKSYALQGIRGTRCFLQGIYPARLEFPGSSQVTFTPNTPVPTNRKSTISQLAKYVLKAGFLKATVCSRLEWQVRRHAK